MLFTGVGRASEAPLQSRLRKGKRETMTYAQALQCAHLYALRSYVVGCGPARMAGWSSGQGRHRQPGF